MKFLLASNFACLIKTGLLSLLITKYLGTIVSTVVLSKGSGAKLIETPNYNCFKIFGIAESKVITPLIPIYDKSISTLGL